MAILFENLKLALRNIRGNLLRAILTMMIIAIGISALVGILTAIDGLKTFINNDFASMGANSFSIRMIGSGVHGNDQSSKSLRVPITYKQAMRFRKEFQGASSSSVSIIVSMMAKLRYRDETTNPNVLAYGVDEDYLEISGFELAAGRGFSEVEVRTGSRNIVLGSDIVNKLFGESISPIDKWVSIGNMKFKVVGTLKSKGSSFMTSDNMVLIPLTTARTNFLGPNASYVVSAKVEHPDKLGFAVDEAIGFFRAVRQLRVREENDFEITKRG